MKKVKDENKIIEEKCTCNHIINKYPHNRYANGGIYGLGLIGSAIFFIGQATTFWQGVLGFLKALVWPALMTYELFKYLIK